MKKQLLALSMVAASGLFGQTDAPKQGQMQNQSNCCNQCACNPCCCTNPRPCVDCECYVPQFYNLQCDWGFSFDAEFLYWYARETNLSYAAKIPMVLDIPDTPQQNTFTRMGVAEQKNLDTDWDPGFRLGVGFNSSCDGWDYNLTWTWFQNKQKNSTSVPPFLFQLGTLSNDLLANAGDYILLNPWVNAPQNFDRVAAKYHLRFNQIDLDLGRKYWLSECFNLRPFIGLRGAWTRVRFSTHSTRDFSFTPVDVTTTTSNVFKDQFKTRFWGVGLIGGLEPTWYFSRCFGLYGLIGSGLIWGDFEVKKSENYSSTRTTSGGSVLPTSLTVTYSDTGKYRHAQMTGILDLGLGIRWERTWCCDRYRSALDLGWEHHIFFDQNHRYKVSGYFTNALGEAEPRITATGYDSYDEATGNLGFGGFVLRLHLDF